MALNTYFILLLLLLLLFGEPIRTYNISILGRCSQHRGGEPERAKGADGMHLNTVVD